MVGKRTAWWRYAVGLILFWLLAAYGEFIPLLLNALQPDMARFGTGSLGYYVLNRVSTAIGAYIACLVTDKITEEGCPLFCMVNTIIASVLFVAMTAYDMYWWEYEDAFSIGLAALVFIVASVIFGLRVTKR